MGGDLYYIHERKRRSREIKKIAIDFKNMGLTECGKVLESISNAVLRKDRSVYFEEELKRLLDAFQQEYILRSGLFPPFNEECFHSVMDIRSIEKGRRHSTVSRTRLRARSWSSISASPQVPS